MQLNKLLFWKSNEREKEQSDVNESANIPTTSIENIIDFPLKDDTSKPTPSKNYRAIYKSLIDDNPELDNFFDDNYYYRKGFYDGVNHRSLDSFNMGQEELVSKFTNELKKMIQEKMRFVDESEVDNVDIKNVNKSISEKLYLTCLSVKREISLLEQQIDLAEKAKGWVAEAANKYKRGFTNGQQLYITNKYLGRSINGGESHE